MRRLTAGQTLQVKGEGGSVFDMDVPADPVRSEIFDGMVAKGQLEVLTDPDARVYDSDAEPVDAPADPPAAPEAGDGVPDGTIAQIVAWVNGDPSRAHEALVAEQTGKQRPTLIAELEAYAQAPADPPAAPEAGDPPATEDPPSPPPADS